MNMKENPANGINDTMWKFLIDGDQKANIPRLKEYVYDLIQMTTQKTAGQGHASAKSHISWSELDMTLMSIVIELKRLHWFYRANWIRFKLVEKKTINAQARKEPSWEKEAEIERNGRIIRLRFEIA